MRDLKSDLELCNKAYKGPWEIDERFYWQILNHDTKISGGSIAKVFTLKNAEFIAAAREGWPEAIERAIAAEEDLSLVKANITGSKTADDIVEYLEKIRSENAALREENAKLLAVVEVAKELYYMGTNFGNYENGNTCMGIDEGKVMAGKVFGKFEKALAELEGVE